MSKNTWINMSHGKAEELKTFLENKYPGNDYHIEKNDEGSYNLIEEPKKVITASA